jgi:hypothetical protein
VQKLKPLRLKLKPLRSNWSITAKKNARIVRYLRNLSVSLLEGSRTSDLREFSKFRGFSENRSVLFPSALATPRHKAMDAKLVAPKFNPNLIVKAYLDNADYRMYSTFLTDSPGSVLFSTSNLLKRKDLCFSCLRQGLIGIVEG